MKGATIVEKSFENEVITRLTKIETKLDDYQRIRDDSVKALHISKSNDCAIKEMKDNNKWLWRTVMGTILGLIISSLLTIVKLK